MKVGRELRSLVIERLEAEIPALAEKVFDKATADTTYPYASLGPSYWSPRPVTCVAARLMTLQIDVWHRESSKGECEDLVDEVSTALDGWSDTAGLAMHPFAVSLVRVMDDPNGDVHGVVQVDVLVEGAPG